MAKENKNIEEFFKRFSETYPSQISFKEAHWADMEAMLDKELPTGPSTAGTPPPVASTVSIITLVVLAIGVLWNYYIQRPTSQNDYLSENASAAVVESGHENHQKSGQENIVVAEQMAAADKVNARDEPIAEAPEKVRKSQAARPEQPAESQAPMSSDTSVSSTASAQGSETSPISPSAVDRDDQRLVESQETVSPLSADSNDDSNDTKSTVSEAGTSFAPFDRLFYFTWLPAESTSASLPLTVASVELDEPVPVKEVPSWPRLALALSFSPDFSSNQLGRYNRTGSEIGLLMEYRFKPRWSLEIGLLSTRKKYKVGAEEYSQPPGFWSDVTSGQVPEWIDADCHVLDIPVNIRYRFIENEVSSFSASVGLSSYLMLSEDYEYELTYGSGAWGSGHENNHFLSVGNVQLYYERKLGRYFAVEAAPFLKLPLSGYGHGNIKFHSLGMFLNVKRYFSWK